jgi:N-acetylglucosaminyldiphosphoundecaprenol N-acetyl-beta-D-mannosaminyltransferase
MPYVNALGVRLSTVPLAVAVDAVVQWAASRDPSGPRYVCATSVHGVVEAQRDPQFRQILNGADLVAPDGVPLVWFGRLSGHRHMQRVYGPGLMLAVCELSARLGLRHFFYGGEPGVAEDLAGRLTARFPGFRVAGTECPPFRPLSPSELQATAARINNSHADIVWVGLSTPKQEHWIAQARGLLKVGVLLSVGAAFNFHTERLVQAPAWVQRLGMEWLFRLAQEPRRLWRRYAGNNPKFVYLAAVQLAGLRKFPD